MTKYLVNDRIVTLAAIFSLCGPVMFVSADVLTVLISTNYNPVNQSISDLMLTPYGWIEKAGIIATAIPLVLLSFQYLSSKSRDYKEKYAAGFLLGSIALCSILLVVFNTDPNGFHASLNGRVHIIAAAMVSIFFPTTCFLMAAVWGKSDQSGLLVVYTVATGLVGIVEIIRALNFFDIPQGLTQRSLCLVNLVWIGTLGLYSRLPILDSRRV
jgi:hypothetical membrane protein